MTHRYQYVPCSRDLAKQKTGAKRKARTASILNSLLRQILLWSFMSSSLKRLFEFNGWVLSVLLLQLHARNGDIQKH